MNYSEKIHYLRRKNGMSQIELAEQLHISNRAISKWEKGVSKPSLEHFYKLSKLFQVPIDFFFEEGSKGGNDDGSASLGMHSLKELYNIGYGPSSSHTMGPERACRFMRRTYPKANRFQVSLYGSLAKTGIGHGTDRVIRKTFEPLPVTVDFDYTSLMPHPNTMELTAFAGEKILGKERIFSVGGGKIKIEGRADVEPASVYPHSSFADIARDCRERDWALWQYVEAFEGPEIFAYLGDCWQAMKDSIRAGLNEEGILPGGLEVQRKAKYLFSQHHIDETAETRENRMVCAYAFAVSEENACGNRIVTAPTCGASGVVPAVLYYQQKKRGYSDDAIVKALAAGGIIGNLIKTNASISGAECGCQAEIGSACAMAASMLGQLFELDLGQIEYAAEIAMEHHLGLTCDPVCGLVQIPCIERNAVAAMRAINAVSLANFLSTTRKISLDKVIKTMKETGQDLSKKYRETAEGGLAKTWAD